MAFWAFLTHRGDPVAAMAAAAQCGYDADTTASMAGTLAGAATGAHCLPENLVGDLEYRDELRLLALVLHDRASFSPTERRRPATAQERTLTLDEVVEQAGFALGLVRASLDHAGRPIFATAWTGGNHQFACTAHLQPPDEVVICSDLPNNVPTQRRHQVRQLLWHINAGLTAARLEIDSDTGKVWAQSIARGKNGPPGTIDVENAFMASVSRMDTYLPAIGAVAFQGVSPLAVLRSIARVASDLDAPMAQYIDRGGSDDGDGQGDGNYDSAVSSTPGPWGKVTVRENDIPRALGCFVADNELQSEHIPPIGSGWLWVWRFASAYDGYTTVGSFEAIAEIGHRVLATWSANGTVPEDLATLRTALFFEQRRYHHFGSDPSPLEAQ